jgi:superfamily I DNA/RNA helicase
VAVPKSKLLNGLVSVLHQSEIPYLKFSGSKTTGDRNGVVLSTMHNLKGHEYKIVFLTGLSADTYPGRPSGSLNWTEEDIAAYNKQRAALLYVACSRAVWRLHLSGVGEGCGMVEI